MAGLGLGLGLMLRLGLGLRVRVSDHVGKLQSSHVGLYKLKCNGENMVIGKLETWLYAYIIMCALKIMHLFFSPTAPTTEMQNMNFCGIDMHLARANATNTTVTHLFPKKNSP